MLVRAVFLARYICLFAALVLGLSALHHGSAYEALKALVLLAVAIGGHAWLKRRGRLAECDQAFESMFAGEAPAGDEDGLDSLLQRREALEEMRGSPGFDPWEVQAVRREISDYLRQHPESTRDLDGRW